MIQSLPKRDESTIYICIFMQSPVFICGSFALYIGRAITNTGMPSPCAFCTAGESGKSHLG